MNMHEISARIRKRFFKAFSSFCANPFLACFASVNIRETSTNNSVVAIGPLFACVFSVFLCLSHVCEHTSLSACAYLLSVNQAEEVTFTHVRQAPGGYSHIVWVGV